MNTESLKAKVQSRKSWGRSPKPEVRSPSSLRNAATEDGRCEVRQGGEAWTAGCGGGLIKGDGSDELGVMLKVTRWLKALFLLAVCCWLGLGLAAGWAAEGPARGGAQAGVIEITQDALLDHIRGGWTGMLIGGIEGLAHEFKYIQEPRASLPEYRFLPDGARSDDDNDFEWTHLWFMDKEGSLKLGYPRIVEIWRANMNRGLWAANRQARKLMDEGIIPPETASPARNSYAPFNLSGQFCVEAYGMIAPGMPQTAANLGVHYAGIAVSGEPLQAAR